MIAAPEFWGGVSNIAGSYSEYIGNSRLSGSLAKVIPACSLKETPTLFPLPSQFCRSIPYSSPYEGWSPGPKIPSSVLIKRSKTSYCGKRSSRRFPIRQAEDSCNSSSVSLKQCAVSVLERHLCLSVGVACFAVHLSAAACLLKFS